MSKANDHSKRLLNCQIICRICEIVDVLWMPQSDFVFVNVLREEGAQGLIAPGSTGRLWDCKSGPQTMICEMPLPQPTPNDS